MQAVKYFKLLGVYLNSNLSWNTNSEKFIKKARQRIYFLRKLKAFTTTQNILINLYRATIESVLTFAVIPGMEA